MGAGMSGMVAAYELMKLGLRPVVYEASHMGGRLRSQQFEGAPTGVIAELGGMRFPVSSTTFYHYVDLLGLETEPFPNPLTPGIQQHGYRYRRHDALRRAARHAAGAIPGGGPGLGRCAGKRGVHQDSGCDPSP